MENCIYMDTDKRISYTEGRRDCYQLLSSFFYPPGKKNFILKNFTRNLTVALTVVCPEASAFSEKMGEAIVQYSNDELSVAFARLFLGPYELIAPPYGSVYLDGGRNVMGNSTIETLKLYRESGVVIKENFGELPDHIAVELEFMYYLIFGEISSLVEAHHERAMGFVEMQAVFLNGFLGHWVPPFCRRICSGTENAFYKLLGSCVSSFVNSDRTFVNTFLEKNRMQSSGGARA